MKKIVLLLGLFLIMGCAQAQDQGAKSSIEWMFNLTAAQDKALAEGKPILIDF